MSQKNYLHGLTLIPSLRCNFQCAHCCRSSGPGRSERMTDAILREVSEIASNSEVHKLCISGGEPFSWRPEFLLKVLRHMPSYQFEGIYIATNGAFAASEARRRWFFMKFLPEAKMLLHDYADLGLHVELSNDQFHQEQMGYHKAEQGWKCLRLETEGFGYHDEYWNEYEWHYPDMEHVTLSERSGQMRVVMPIGPRGRHYWRGEATQYCDFDGNGSRYENELAIWPDGRVSACCDGGAWVGNIMTQGWRDILRQRRRFLFHLRRVTGAYQEECGSWQQVPSGVPLETCADCRKIGRQYFKTSFRRSK